MTNTNCLEGIKCPQCGNGAHFRIEAVIVCHVTDDGSEPTGDHHWDKDSFCHCPGAASARRTLQPSLTCQPPTYPTSRAGDACPACRTS